MLLRIALALRFLGLVGALFIFQILAGLSTRLIPQPPIQDVGGVSPLTFGQAAVIVTVVLALVLGLLARHAIGTFFQRSVFLFVFVFTVNCGLSAVEAAFFLAAVRMQMLNVAALLVDGLLLAAMVAPSAAALIPPREDLQSSESVRSARAAWPVVLFYLIAYSLAGYFIAWQSSAVRAYYDFGSGIHVTQMLPLQIARGTVWLGVTLLCVRFLRGPRGMLAVLVGVGYASFMALPLLLPGPLMPWPVRAAHLIEIASSNTIFGIVAFLWLSTTARSPRAATGPGSFAPLVRGRD